MNVKDSWREDGVSQLGQPQALRAGEASSTEPARRLASCEEKEHERLCPQPRERSSKSRMITTRRKI